MGLEEQTQMMCPIKDSCEDYKPSTLCEKGFYESCEAYQFHNDKLAEAIYIETK
ncbi:hypothetical protein J4404_00110 [Candidatus Woesearchaeota archaeon]|nr:hypothetical protein [Candidatus Woesearchaeota archaeon]